MKRITAALLLISSAAFCQTNSFPSSGNAKIFAIGENWAEGLTVVRSSGWSGLRFTRNDPTGGNYNGNWALGYNGATGNDFSISTNYLGTQYDGLFHISNSTRFVGIGTIAPQGLLHVQGTGNKWIYFANNIDGGGNPQNTQGMAFGWNRTGGQGESIMVYNTSLGSSPRLDFSSFNGSSYSTEMTLRGGNLGIGTTTPNQKLTVNGTIYGKEVKVDLSVPGPDYVFEKSYALPTLEEVKSYIDQNKHLPEFPSAKEMEANGVNIGEMNMLLLKKIEELTLYIIEQNKRIEKLEKK